MPSQHASSPAAAGVLSTRHPLKKRYDIRAARGLRLRIRFAHDMNGTPKGAKVLREQWISKWKAELFWSSPAFHGFVRAGVVRRHDSRSEASWHPNQLNDGCGTALAMTHRSRIHERNSCQSCPRTEPFGVENCAWRHPSDQSRAAADASSACQREAVQSAK